MFKRLFKLSLHRRLFISHLLVLVLGLLSFVLIRRLSFSYFFAYQLDLLEADGIIMQSARELLLSGLRSARDTSTLMALASGALSAAVLSYWAAHRINRSLMTIEQVAYRLATGHLDERVPISQIPELARLGRSLNQMVIALEGAEQRRREMVTDLSHELRTPLTVIRGYLEDIDSDCLQETPEIRQRLIAETRRLERLINGLQDLSKAESGSLSLSLAAFSVQPLLASLVDRFSSQLSEEGPVLQLMCDERLPLVWADCDRTEQILINLLGNAIRYTQRGHITLKAWTQDNKVWISVSDTGHGISSGDLPHIFERFWRSASSRVHHSGGTGIGLTITRQLVELQGGKIWVESQLGEGTTFTFCLPTKPT